MEIEHYVLTPDSHDAWFAVHGALVAEVAFLSGGISQLTLAPLGGGGQRPPPVVFRK